MVEKGGCTKGKSEVNNSTLKGIVQDYTKCKKVKMKAYLKTFSQGKSPSLQEVIRRAAMAESNDGKRFSHQRRIPRKVLEAAKQQLTQSHKAIRRCNKFEQLFELVKRKIVTIKGIGELTLYDTTLRIGAFLELFPSDVYLHAGTRVGAKALGLNHRAKKLPPSAFPPQLRSLKPHEIEDLLCIYKDSLIKLRRVNQK